MCIYRLLQEGAIPHKPLLSFIRALRAQGYWSSRMNGSLSSSRSVRFSVLTSGLRLQPAVAISWHIRGRFLIRGDKHQAMLSHFELPQRTKVTGFLIPFCHKEDINEVIYQTSFSVPSGLYGLAPRASKTLPSRFGDARLFHP